MSGDQIFIAIVAVEIVGMAWALWCNNKTYKQRMAILRGISGHSRFLISRGDYGAWRAYYDRFATISYGRHWWLLMTFRDPSSMYDWAPQEASP